MNILSVDEANIIIGFRNVEILRSYLDRSRAASSDVIKCINWRELSSVPPLDSNIPYSYRAI